MVFSSISFLYYFLPGALLVCLLTPDRWKNGALLAVSLAFYAWGEPKYVWLMAAAIVLFYLCGLGIAGAKRTLWRRFWLGLSLAGGVGLLAVFKYGDFLLSTVSAVTGAPERLLGLALPIGISFYTFQGLSYTIDLYRGRGQAQRNLVDFGAYVAMFPPLIAGPIVRYGDVAEQMERRRPELAAGMRRFLVGLGKKVLLANQFGELMAIFRDSGQPSVLFCWMYAIANLLHYYFDFSGYSDMAIGLGRMLGFRFPENFDYPYLSRSSGEFWRRWHMTLGGWFRDYVYIPLGGSRMGKGRWVRNILAVWALTGLWHGASWNFVLWGLGFGVLLLLEKGLHMERLPAWLGHGYVLLTVCLSFVLFSAEDLGQAAGDFAALFGLGGSPLATQETLYYLRSFGVLLLAGVLGATPVVKRVASRWQNCQILETLVLLALLLLCTAYLVDGSFNPFLYFRF